MACVIAAPSSGSGKTILSMTLSSWARSNGLTIQTFKIGPDFLDPKQLTFTSGRNCRNLDLILSNSEWITENFSHYCHSADLSIVEGVMGLFDGIGASERGSTAEIAKILNLPIVLIIEAKGQAASLAALVKGFINHDPQLNFAGVVLNKVNSDRHREILEKVLTSIGIKLLGCLPNNSDLALPSRHLGLIPTHEIYQLKSRVKSWAHIAESALDLEEFRKLLKSPKKKNNFTNRVINNQSLEIRPIAIAEDDAFHFQYQDTKDALELLGMPAIPWEPLQDMEIPKEAMGLIIPGGFPESYAEDISKCLKSIGSLKKAYGKIPIYAECGGMMLLGQSITDLNGKNHKMSGLLPFHAEKGNLTVGYRNLKSLRKSLILDELDDLVGHEFHYWKLNFKHVKDHSINLDKENNNSKLSCPWVSNGWGLKPIKEGWCNDLFHASWIHLHWSSNPKLLIKWRNSLEKKINKYKNHS